MVDPQLDTNVLIKILATVPEFVAYAVAKQGDGLGYNEATALQFLAKGNQADLDKLARQYGVSKGSDSSLTEIDDAAQRLQKAFRGDRLGRVLHSPDARVAATAFLMKEVMATGDLQFFKRARDLGIPVDFIGSSAVSLKAQAYVPRPVMVPSS